MIVNCLPRHLKGVDSHLIRLQRDCRVARHQRARALSSCCSEHIVVVPVHERHLLVVVVVHLLGQID